MKRGFLILLGIAVMALAGYLVLPWVSYHPVEFRAVEVAPELSGRRVLRYEVKNTSWFTVTIYSGNLYSPDVVPYEEFSEFMRVGELKPGEVFEGQYLLERDRPFSGARAGIDYYWNFPLREKIGTSTLIRYTPDEIRWRLEKLREPRQTTITNVELPGEFGASP